MKILSFVSERDRLEADFHKRDPTTCTLFPPASPPIRARRWHQVHRKSWEISTRVIRMDLTLGPVRNV